MKLTKLIFLFSILFFIFSIPVVATDFTGVVNDGVFCLNVRSGPGVENKILTEIHEGQTFDVSGQSGNWYSIILNDNTHAWVYGKYITVTEVKSVVTLLSPLMNAHVEKKNILFKWNCPESADYYRLVVRDQTDQTKKYEYMPKDKEYTIKKLSDGHLYKWMVAPVTDEKVGEYSKTFQFTVGQAQVGPCPEIKEVYVVSSLIGSASEIVPTASSKIVPHASEVKLYAIVKGELEGKLYYFLGDTSKQSQGYPVQAVIYNRDAKTVKKVDLARWNTSWGDLEFKWGDISARLYHKNLPHYSGEDSPDYVWYTNVVPNGPNECKWWKWDRLEYAEEKISPKSKWWQFVLPFLKKSYTWCATVPQPENGGTNRFKVLVQHKQNKQVISHIESYGKFENPFDSSSVLVEDDYNFGIKDDIHRIIYLGNTPNKFLQALLGYKGIPWIYGSATHGSIGHQTSAFVGFDCADLAMGAWKTGMDNSFTVTSGAHNLCTTITRPMAYGNLEFAKYGDDDGNGGFVRQDTIFDAANIPVIIAVGPENSENANNISDDKGNNNEKICPGDVVFWDWDKNGKWDHTTVFYKDGTKNKGFLSTDDYFIWASHDGVAVKQLIVLLKNSRTRFVIKKWTK